MRGDLTLSGLLEQVFVFDRYAEVLVLLQNSLWAGALVGLVGGIIGTFVVMRDMPFSVHGIAELSFAGGAIALLAGTSIVTGSLIGSVVAALLIGVLGARSRGANSVVGVLMPFGLGVGILALSLYQGRSANQFALLTGQIVSVSEVQLAALAVLSVVVIAGLLVIWRPLSFASLDPAVAQARGVPLRGLSIVFMLLLGVAVALSVQIIGALLVLALVVTPAAAAMSLTASPGRIVALSVLFAELSMVGGTLLALGGSLPISPYVTTISFLIWGIAALIGRRRAAGSARADAQGSGTGQSRTGSAAAATEMTAGPEPTRSPSA
ncbi:metal ABC transporter permease [Kocuria palustris]|uniref:metal ABC transporter permease n=1 Tax=Kocuria palustris TaxID=71999 RepID=UPI0011A923F8|nr:metal ABC transporter permease [Kocuria palustris]